MIMFADVITISSDSSVAYSESLGWSDYFPPLPHGPAVDPNADSRSNSSSISSYVSSYHSSSEDDHATVKGNKGSSSKKVKPGTTSVEAKKSKHTKIVESQTSAGKRIQKPPGPVAVVGLANQKTWEAIKKRLLVSRSHQDQLQTLRAKERNTSLFKYGLL